MTLTLDIKSLLIGLVAGAALVFVLGATTAPPSAVAAARYQVSAGGTGVGFLLDTTTGQVWLNTMHAGEFYPAKQK